MKRAKKTNPKVTIISDYAWATGGTEELVSELLARLDFSGYECTLVTWPLATPTIERATKVITIQNGDVRPLYGAVSTADYVVIVTSFNVRLLSCAVLDALQGLRTPVMTVIQTSTHSDPTALSIPQQEVWLRQIIQASNVTVCASEAVKSSVLRLLPKDTAGSKILTIENGARLSDTRTKGRGHSRVSFIGRPTQAKGFDLFMRLVHDLSPTDMIFAANTVSVIPPLTNTRVSWSWRLDDKQLKEFFASTDLLLVPYRIADGLPLAVLEAINCGVPVMAMDSPAVSPLARRYKQPVIEYKYESLKEALLKWHKGNYVWQAPVGGSVPSLMQQVDAYVNLLDSL